MLILRHTVLLIDSTANDATNARIIVHLIRYAAVFVALILIAHLLAQSKTRILPISLAQTVKMPTKIALVILVISLNVQHTWRCKTN